MDAATLETRQVTAFPALLVMDANRQIAGRLDWCCCFTSAKYLKVSEEHRYGRCRVSLSEPRHFSLTGGERGSPQPSTVAPTIAPTIASLDLMCFFLPIVVSGGYLCSYSPCDLCIHRVLSLQYSPYRLSRTVLLVRVNGSYGEDRSLIKCWCHPYRGGRSETTLARWHEQTNVGIL